MKISKTILTLGAAVTMLSGSVMAAGDCKTGNCDGLSGSGVFFIDDNGNLNTTIEAAIPGYFELNSANEGGTVFTNSNVRVNCVKALEDGSYVMSGYKVTNSRVTYKNHGQGGVNIDNANAVGDKMLGLFRVNDDGTFTRGNWVTGLETCTGEGVDSINNYTGPQTPGRYKTCTQDIAANASLLPDCDEATDEQLAGIPLNRTTRDIDNLTYNP